MSPANAEVKETASKVKTELKELREKYEKYKKMYEELGESFAEIQEKLSELILKSAKNRLINNLLLLIVSMIAGWVASLFVKVPAGILIGLFSTVVIASALADSLFLLARRLWSFVSVVAPGAFTVLYEAIFFSEYSPLYNALVFPAVLIALSAASLVLLSTGNIAASFLTMLGVFFFSVALISFARQSFGKAFITFLLYILFVGAFQKISYSPITTNLEYSIVSSLLWLLAVESLNTLITISIVLSYEASNMLIKKLKVLGDFIAEARKKIPYVAVKAEVDYEKIAKDLAKVVAGSDVEKIVRIADKVLIEYGGKSFEIPRKIYEEAKKLNPELEKAEAQVLEIDDKLYKIDEVEQTATQFDIDADGNLVFKSKMPLADFLRKFGKKLASARIVGKEEWEDLLSKGVTGLDWDKQAALNRGFTALELLMRGKDNIANLAVLEEIKKAVTELEKGKRKILKFRDFSVEVTKDLNGKISLNIAGTRIPEPLNGLNITDLSEEEALRHIGSKIAEVKSKVDPDYVKLKLTPQNVQKIIDAAYFLKPGESTELEELGVEITKDDNGEIKVINLANGSTITSGKNIREVVKNLMKKRSGASAKQIFDFVQDGSRIRISNALFIGKYNNTPYVQVLGEDGKWKTLVGMEAIEFVTRALRTAATGQVDYHDSPKLRSIGRPAYFRAIAEQLANYKFREELPFERIERSLPAPSPPPSPSPTPTPSPTPPPSPKPTPSPTPSPVPVPTPSPTPSPEPTPEPSTTQQPTIPPSPSPRREIRPRITYAIGKAKIAETRDGKKVVRFQVSYWKKTGEGFKRVTETFEYRGKSIPPYLKELEKSPSKIFELAKSGEWKKVSSTVNVWAPHRHYKEQKPFPNVPAFRTETGNIEVTHVIRDFLNSGTGKERFEEIVRGYIDGTSTPDRKPHVSGLFHLLSHIDSVKSTLGGADAEIRAEELKRVVLQKIIEASERGIAPSITGKIKEAIKNAGSEEEKIKIVESIVPEITKKLERLYEKSWEAKERKQIWSKAEGDLILFESKRGRGYAIGVDPYTGKNIELVWDPRVGGWRRTDTGQIWYAGELGFSGNRRIAGVWLSEEKYRRRKVFDEIKSEIRKVKLSGKNLDRYVKEKHIEEWINIINLLEPHQVEQLSEMLGLPRTTDKRLFISSLEKRFFASKPLPPAPLKAKWDSKVKTWVSEDGTYIYLPDNSGKWKWYSIEEIAKSFERLDPKTAAEKFSKLPTKLKTRILSYIPKDVKNNLLEYEESYRIAALISRIAQHNLNEAKRILTNYGDKASKILEFIPEEVRTKLLSGKSQ